MPLTPREVAEKVHSIKDNRLYIVLKKQVNVDHFDLVSLETKMKKANAIFQRGKNHDNDGKRKQLSEVYLNAKQKTAIAPISIHLGDCFELVGDGRTIKSDASVLQSDPGCTAQHPHCDFNLEGEPGLTRLSYLVLVALQDHTKLVVYTSKGCSKIVWLMRGDVLIARGDCIHAGSSFDVLNIRLHWYFDYPLNLRDPGHTYFYHFSTNSVSAHDYVYEKQTASLTNAREELKRRGKIKKHYNDHYEY